MTNFVQLYKSTDVGAPALAGSAGYLITMLNKVLVDGYATASVTSITRSGATATVTLAVANSTLVSGNYIKIAGAVETDYNGTFQITVTDSTHFTYTVPGTPTTPATGTIVYNKAGLGWTRPFAGGTNSQTYRSADVASNQFYLQIIDNGVTAGGTKEAQAYGAEVMSADQAVTSGQFPTTAQFASGMCWRKSDTADTNSRPWTIIGDDKTFYLQTQPANVATTSSQLYGFGHFISFKAGDVYNTFIAGGSAFNTTSTLGGLIASQGSATATQVTTGLYLARAYSQVGSAINGSVCGFGGLIIGGSLVLNYPNGADTGYYVNPVFVCEPTNTGSIRGRFPGFYNPLHSSPLSNWDIATGVVGLSGVTLTTITGSSSTVGQGAFDTFGPWT